jgi:hypothetical protein
MPNDVAMVGAIYETRFRFLRISAHNVLQAAFKKHKEIANIDVVLQNEQLFFVINRSLARRDHGVHALLVQRRKAARLGDCGAHFGKLVLGDLLLL